MKAILNTHSLSISKQGKQILEKVTLELRTGDFVALVGPNGSGKTTLLRALAGLESSVSQGQVFFNEVDLFLDDPETRVKKILYVGSSLSTQFPISVEEVIKNQATDEAFEACRILAELGAGELLKLQLRALSAGERQLVLLSRALARRPKILLLDETLSKLDLHHLKRAFLELERYKNDGGTTVWISHDWNLALRFSEKIWLLHNRELKTYASTSELPLQQVLDELFPNSGILAFQDNGRARIEL